MKIWRITIIAVLSLLLLAAAIGWALLWQYARQDTVPPGVLAGHIPIGGLEIDAAIQLAEDYEDALMARTIDIQGTGPASDRYIKLASELGYRAQFLELKAALLRLREGDLLERAKYRYRFPSTFELSQSWKQELFENALRKQWGWIEESEPANAARFITEEDEVRYEIHRNAFRLETAELVRAVSGWMIEKEQGGVAHVERKVFRAELPVAVVEPETTLEKLQDEGVARKIISFTTSFATSSEGRAHNITVTAETLHDWHLAPDEIFSYSELIHLTEEHHQYQEAPVILNGRLVPGIGGGICQVSSTLYQAVLRAGLDIVERRNHSLPVAYLPLGHDATYATDAIDFKFRNSTGKHLIIRTEVKDRQLTVKLFGTMPENERYEIDSKTVRTIAPEVKQFVNETLTPGSRVVKEQGKQGYVVDTYRTLLRDEEVISRERISRDTYRAQSAIVEVGPAVISTND
ncbi:VanW family protein [Paenibacillus chungangensis]|uniref:VanW family protein n=1 Tax=Paenibacillus chungangensis TaxID=696535 RepID=A0ABW3HWF4_9BACL